MKRFKKGDLVVLSKSSYYYQIQSTTEGGKLREFTIVDIHQEYLEGENCTNRLVITVIANIDDYQNIYAPNDLEIIERKPSLRKSDKWKSLMNKSK